MPWRLRRAGEGDAPAASLVAGASFLETFAGILTGPDIVAHVAAKSGPPAFAAWIADSGSVVTLAEQAAGSAPIGYTVLTAPDDVGPVSPTTIELRRIYTLSIARGTGLGAALMTRAIEDARLLGHDRLVLGVLGINVRACNFYERQGFAMVGERRFKVGVTWHDDRVYGRDL